MQESVEFFIEKIISPPECQKFPIKGKGGRIFSARRRAAGSALLPVYEKLHLVLDTRSYAKIVHVLTFVSLRFKREKERERVAHVSTKGEFSALKSINGTARAT